MRSTLEISIAVKENAPATETELRYALEAMASIEHFIEQDLRRLIDAIENDKPSAKMTASFAKETLSRMFDARKKPVDVFLGPDNLPGCKAQQERLRIGKKIFKAATGIDLDEPAGAAQ